MNIKNIRRNYENLTMLERLSLADNARSRGDQSELQAINLASPKESCRQVDFYDLMKQITHFRLCNLIVRLSYITQFNFFCELAELEILKNKSSYGKYEKYLENAKMSAFLYFRAKDSWQIVSDELCLRADFDEEISAFLFSYDLMKQKEIIMREMTLSQDEANEHLEKHFGGGQIKTVEDEASSIREVLGLSKS